MIPKAVNTGRMLSSKLLMLDLGLASFEVCSGLSQLKFPQRFRTMCNYISTTVNKYNVSNEERIKAKTEGVKEVVPQRKTKVLKIAFIGRPNAGKSTLINQIIGRTVCPISMRAHTTRLKARAVANEGDTQLIFLDTPGVVFEREIKMFKFDQSFLISGDDAAVEADVLGVVYDATDKYQESGSLDSSTIRMLLLHRRKKSFLIVNKVDAVKKKVQLLEICRKLIGDTKSQKSLTIPSDNVDEVTVKELTKTLHSWPYFDEVFMISALEGDVVGDIKEYLLRQANPGPWLIKPKSSFKKEEEQIAINFVRAAFLDELPGEIPYNLEYKLAYFEENDELCAVEVYVKPKQKRYVSFLLKSVKIVAKTAEHNISSALERPCRLRINIDILED